MNPAKRSRARSRIPADATPVLVMLTALMVTVWVAAFVISFTGLRDAAQWANLEGTETVALPMMIDVFLAGASVGYLVARERQDTTTTRIFVAVMVGFGSLSVAANGVHAMAADVASLAQRIVGVALAVAAPVAILAATEVLARTVVSPPPPVKRDTPAPAPAATLPAASFVPKAAPTPAETPVEQPTSAPAPASPKGSKGGAARAEQRAQVLALAAEGLSVNAIHTRLGGSPARSTISLWLREAQERGELTAA